MSISQGLHNNEIAKLIQEFSELSRKSCQTFDEVRNGWQDQRQRDFFNKYIDKIRDELVATKSDLEMLNHQLVNLQNTLNNLNNV